MKLIEVCNQIDVWDNWRDSYKRYVPEFIQEAKNKSDWKNWDKDVFNEYFERAREQCVSSLQQGYFSKDEQKRIKDNWSEIGPMLKSIAESQDLPPWDLYTGLQQKIRSFTKVNRKAATFRMIAGLQPNLLCTVINEENLRQIFRYLKLHTTEKVPELTYNWYKDSHNIFQLFKNSFPTINPEELVTYPWQTKLFFEGGMLIQNNNDMSDSASSQVIELLKYKKQIILQGPPGTGKTKLAKEIAEDLLFNKLDKVNLTQEIIRQYMKPGLKFSSSKDKLQYEVEKVNVAGVSVIASTGKVYTPVFKEIIEAYNKKIWEVDGAIKNGNDSYSAGIAKYIDGELQKRNELNNSDEFKLIQFHPSYTYEDFVRGIESKPNPDGGEGVFYEAVDKTLGKFAKDALNNYKLSQATNTEDSPIKSFDSFLSYVLEQIDINEKYMISEKVYIFYADDKRFKYKGDNWTAHPNGLNMNYSELQKIISLGLQSRQDINKNKGLNALTRQHATYYQNVVERYREHINKTSSPINEQTTLKNYVLIIDEINRANLSSVLGELIYALEYRGEKVESMYEVDGKNALVLPPNLYIIGTMNTADRSVGHIDYAIRRRFAFVDVLPEDLTNTLSTDFKTELFQKVADLFRDKHVSPEFKAKDVQLGHSYFIQQYEKDDFGKNIVDKPYDFKMRLDYEIVPILKEYLNDGVFKNDPETRKKIEEIEDYQFS